jgi:hypothetical protein
MKNFLNEFMEDHKSKGPRTIAGYREMFVNTVAEVGKALGRKPFHIHAGLNAAAYDSVMVAFALRKRKRFPKDVKRRFKRLLSNEKYVYCIASGTTDVDVVRKRFSLARRILFREK